MCVHRCRMAAALVVMARVYRPAGQPRRPPPCPSAERVLVTRGTHGGHASRGPGPGPCRNVSAMAHGREAATALLPLPATPGRTRTTMARSNLYSIGRSGLLRSSPVPLRVEEALRRLTGACRAPTTDEETHARLWGLSVAASATPRTRSASVRDRPTWRTTTTSWTTFRGTHGGWANTGVHSTWRA